MMLADETYLEGRSCASLLGRDRISVLLASTLWHICLDEIAHVNDDGVHGVFRPRMARKESPLII
jgi:hypothetical protein